MTEKKNKIFQAQRWNLLNNKKKRLKGIKSKPSGNQTKRIFFLSVFSLPSCQKAFPRQPTCVALDPAEKAEWDLSKMKTERERLTVELAETHRRRQVRTKPVGKKMSGARNKNKEKKTTDKSGEGEATSFRGPSRRARRQSQHPRHTAGRWAGLEDTHTHRRVNYRKASQNVTAAWTLNRRFNLLTPHQYASAEREEKEEQEDEEKEEEKEEEERRRRRWKSRMKRKRRRRRGIPTLTLFRVCQC